MYLQMENKGGFIRFAKKNGLVLCGYFARLPAMPGQLFFYLEFVVNAGPVCADSSHKLAKGHMLVGVGGVLGFADHLAVLDGGKLAERLAPL